MKISINAKMYRNTGTYTVPVWNEIPGVHDVTLNLPIDEADVSTRGGGGFKASEPTLMDAAVEFDMPWEETDTDLTEFRTRALARTSLDMLVLDGDAATAGSQGLRATMKVFEFTREEALDDALRASLRLKPCLAANAPVWFVAP
jgi:hypothetical protein